MSFEREHESHINIQLNAFLRKLKEKNPEKLL